MRNIQKQSMRRLPFFNRSLRAQTKITKAANAIHCAALELLKMDGFEFQYVFKDKDDYTAYTDRYTAAYTEKSDLIRAEVIRSIPP